MGFITNEIKAEGNADGHIDARWILARELLLSQKFTIDEIADFVGLTDAELQEWKKELLTEDHV